MEKSFGILAHKFTDSLKMTVEYLSSYESNKIFIHVDKNVDINEFIVLAKKNVTIIEDRVAVKWGHISIVIATLTLMKAAQEYNFDYFSLISGEDIVASSNDEIDSILESSGKEFIHFQDSRNKIINPVERVVKIYNEQCFRKEKSAFTNAKIKLKMLRTNRYSKKYLLDNNIVLYKGTQWFTLTYRMVDFIITYLENNPNYLLCFENSFCPDEIFFHTIVKISGFPTYHNASLMNDCCRYIDWTSGPEYPKCLNVDDLNKIRGQGYLFARKAGKDLTISDMKYLTDTLKS